MATADDFKLIRDIHATGGRRQVFGARERLPFEELVEIGWLKRSSVDTRATHYQITERGTAAALRS
ncbi:TenA/THI-4 family protein [Rhodopseudomonas palustris]|uniref:TenA/THI-4 family protein n=1 Tax=Rhodopseudomonas palustris TaxID=1076 RepID=A0A323UNY4_RHOPL|nr:TenA/THI-4 family protein [Rhodopseudomonas palustris]PZA14061.1 TenA/THI-4 family protein [Rhodopseudomonas palustris]